MCMFRKAKTNCISKHDLFFLSLLNHQTGVFHCRELSASLLRVYFHPVENTQMMYKINTGQSFLCIPTILRTFLGTQDPLINKISKAQNHLNVHLYKQKPVSRHQLLNQPKLYSLRILCKIGHHECK